MKTRMMRVLAVIVMAGSVWAGYGEAAEPSRQRPAASEVFARTELYFGTSRVGQPEVSEEEFMAFLDAEVTPRFPDGLTLLTGYGQFLGSSGSLTKERSKVLILFYPVNTKDASKNIQAIRKKYNEQFQQESVLRVDSLTMISF